MKNETDESVAFYLNMKRKRQPDTLETGDEVAFRPDMGAKRQHEQQKTGFKVAFARIQRGTGLRAHRPSD